MLVGSVLKPIPFIRNVAGLSNVKSLIMKSRTKLRDEKCLGPLSNSASTSSSRPHVGLNSSLLHTTSTRMHSTPNGKKWSRSRNVLGGGRSAGTKLGTVAAEGKPQRAKNGLFVMVDAYMRDVDSRLLRSVNTPHNREDVY